MIEKIRGKHVDNLFRAIKSLNGIEEFYKLFDDLCTISEINEMSRRLQAAKLLSDGVVYSEISEITGLSTATISRVNRCLKYGSDGYAIVLERMKNADIFNEK
ncbi:hypothetical protein FACS1894219_07990 [Clostridia bacterium]|nr:hypothetical protein FACS1894219_07990 [Clostridia bacterium]